MTLSDLSIGATLAIGVSEWFRRSHDSDVAVLPYAFELVPTGDVAYGVRFHVPLTL
jgi:hypothetical protein